MAAQEINIKDVLDYCWCPLYYELKHKNEKEKNIKQLYDEALHRVIYSYLLELQTNGAHNAIRFLKWRWGKEWVKQKTSSEIICTPSAVKRDYYDFKRKTGIEAIFSFKDMMDTPQFPILFNKKYNLAITKDIVLTGTWEYIREVEREDGSKIMQILKFRTEHNRFLMESTKTHDLELTAAAFAFAHTFGVKDFELIYVDLCKKRMVRSYRKDKDYSLLRHTVRSVVYCLNHNVKCISPDTRCFHCEYRDICARTLG